MQRDIRTRRDQLSWLCCRRRRHSIQFNSIQFHSIQFNSIPRHSIQFNSLPFHSIQFYSIQFNSIQFNAFLLNLLSCHVVVLLSSFLTGRSFHGPTGLQKATVWLQNQVFGQKLGPQFHALVCFSSSIRLVPLSDCAEFNAIPFHATVQFQPNAIFSVVSIQLIAINDANDAIPILSNPVRERCCAWAEVDRWGPYPGWIRPSRRCRRHWQRGGSDDRCASWGWLCFVV